VSGAGVPEQPRGDSVEGYPRHGRKLQKAAEEFHAHIEPTNGFTPSDGERCRQGERISTGFVESTVNQVVSIRCC
jgi:hypothetical protein